MPTLKQRLNAGEFVRICGVGRMPHHNLIHVIGMSGGFHGLWFDMEHVGLSSQELEIATMAAREHGLDTFCRVAPTDYATVTRCLEAGSSGVMAAQIFSAEQAEEFVRWSKFSPRGWRGLNTGGWDAKFTMIPAAEFTRKANEETFVAIQIETLPAVEQCEAIAAIDESESRRYGTVFPREMPDGNRQNLASLPQRRKTVGCGDIQSSARRNADR